MATPPRPDEPGPVDVFVYTKDDDLLVRDLDRPYPGVDRFFSVAQAGWRKFRPGAADARLVPADSDAAARAIAAYAAFLAEHPTPRGLPTPTPRVVAVAADRASARGPDAFPLTDEQREIFRHLAAPDAEPLLVAGRAGTGKTTFVRAVQARYDGRVVLLAPTGVAAREVGGQTIHSFFGLPTTVLTEEALEHTRTKARDWHKTIRRAHLVVIDEISMVRPDVLDAVDHLLRDAGDPARPFGGTRVMMVGDLLQLPPVVTGADAEPMRARYGSAEPLVIDAVVFREGQVRIAGLTKVFRQADAGFVALLNRVRRGAFTDADRAMLDARVFRLTADELATRIVLTARNAVADERNATEMAKLRGTPRTYAARATGTFAKAWLEEHRRPAPASIELREGARVMCLRNDPAGRWVNGSLGEIVALRATSALVTLDDGGETVEVPRATWEDPVFEYDERAEQIVQRIRGTYDQLPLRLSRITHLYAVSDHPDLRTRRARFAGIRPSVWG